MLSKCISLFCLFLLEGKIPYWAQLKQEKAVIYVPTLTVYLYISGISLARNVRYV